MSPMAAATSLTFGLATFGIGYYLKRDINSFSHRFDNLDARFNRTDDRFEEMDHCFEGMERRLEKMDYHLDGIDSRLGRRLDDLEKNVTETEIILSTLLTKMSGSERKNS